MTIIKVRNYFIVLDKIIFCLTKAGPITELNKVPGNEPTEKQAKKIPAKGFQKLNK